MTIRCLVVDDEPLSRERVAAVLGDLADAEVVGLCANGAEALEAVDRLQPDVLLLDIQMPELDGFGILAALPPASRPQVIFITGHDQYAVRAFEVHAQDYLLKPYDRDRLVSAFNRVAARLREGTGRDAQVQRLQALVDDIERRRNRRTRIGIPVDGAVRLVPVGEIDWIESADNHVVVHVGGQSHALRQTLQALEAELHPAEFVRVHRRAIINIARIREIRPWGNGEYLIVLRSGGEVRTSRSHRARVEALLG
jgi:two-component system LytT family response regulator